MKIFGTKFSSILATILKDLTLEEIIRLLEHPQNDIRANAAGYLQFGIHRDHKNSFYYSILFLLYN